MSLTGADALTIAGITYAVAALVALAYWITNARTDE